LGLCPKLRKQKRASVFVPLQSLARVKIRHPGRILTAEFCFAKLHLSANGGEQWKQRHPAAIHAAGVHPEFFTAKSKK
jgi:hypothetical protein